MFSKVVVPSSNVWKFYWTITCHCIRYFLSPVSLLYILDNFCRFFFQIYFTNSLFSCVLSAVKSLHWIFNSKYFSFLMVFFGWTCFHMFNGHLDLPSLKCFAHFLSNIDSFNIHMYFFHDVCVCVCLCI